LREERCRRYVLALVVGTAAGGQLARRSAEQLALTSLNSSSSMIALIAVIGATVFAATGHEDDRERGGG
jgi:hypothetical protein